jgi:hypothetical protein
MAVNNLSINSLFFGQKIYCKEREGRRDFYIFFAASAVQISFGKAACPS